MKGRQFVEGDAKVKVEQRYNGDPPPPGRVRQSRIAGRMWQIGRLPKGDLMLARQLQMPGTVEMTATELSGAHSNWEGPCVNLSTTDEA